MKSELLPTREKLNNLSSIILASAIEVHRHMGPGLLESIYQSCLVMELRSRGLRVDESVPVRLHYKSTPLEKTFFVDLLIEDEVILELKAVEEIAPVHEAQLLSYLKLADRKLGLLINFNVPLLKEGIKRLVHNF